METAVRTSEKKLQIKIKKTGKRMYKMRYYYLLILPTIVFFVIFHYVPMYGVTLAFKDFRFLDGILKSPWVGFEHFERLFGSKYFYQVLRNTIIISSYKLIFGFPAPIILALLLNEIRHSKFKRTIQTISYLPHFISWVVLAGIIMELLSPARGAVNYIRTLFGKEPIYFLAEPKYFRSILVITHIWQSVGWGTIIYLAAIAGIDQEQYEAAYIDGASRYQLVKYITLPSIRSVISVVFILNLGRILNAGFDQIFNLYNAQVYRVGDIIDTYVYRIGLIDMQYSFSTAVGLFKNVVGLILVLTSNFIIRRLGDGEHGLW
jgi:putative aldouronate transport system permease protein